MVLPEGLEFLKLGWWIIHVLGILLVWSYAYRKGRLDERRAHPPPPATQAEASAAAVARPGGAVGAVPCAEGSAAATEPPVTLAEAPGSPSPAESPASRGD